MTAHGRIHHSRIESRALQGNPLDNPATRDLYLYLPPAYDRDAARRFPVAYVLTGFTGRGRMLLNDNAFTPNIAERMDALIASGSAREMILVLPDCFTRLGGSQYINSLATGAYEDHLIAELIPFVDDNFRTLRAKSNGDAARFVERFYKDEKRNGSDFATLISEKVSSER